MTNAKVQIFIHLTIVKNLSLDGKVLNFNCERW
jgi:hypothetical protein